MKLTNDQPIALLVENDTRLLYPLEEQLGKMGFKVISAQNCPSAEGLINERHDFDLIILDLFLTSEEDGWRIFNLADRHIPPNCARAIFSGHSEQKIRAQLSAWHFFDKGSGTTGLLNFAKEAHSKAMTHRNTLPLVDPERASQIARLMRPEGWNNLYVLGCFDRRITFYTQQARALNLIRSLYELGLLLEGQSVGIVGAGASGVTAAVAASLLKCQVTLLDSAEAILHLQASAGHRYLHPHIYNWPEPNSLNADAGLPFLNWFAATANGVVQTLRHEFEIFCKHLNKQSKNRLQFKKNKKITVVDKVSESRIRLQNETALYQAEYDVVILAIGYGVESEVPSYWSGDLIDGPFYHTPYEILISGNGDGGLIDLARAAMRTDPLDNTFRHDQAVKLLISDQDFKTLALEMSEVDDKCRRRKPQGNLYQEYLSLQIPSGLKGRLEELQRTQTKVTFHCLHDTEIFTLRSALLNRLLAFLLLQFNLVELEYGEMIETPRSTGDNKLHVTFQHPDRKTSEKKFDLVVKRHGMPKSYFKESFSQIYDASSFMRSPVFYLDWTGGLNEETLRFWEVFKRRAFK
jgi:CheY-like chemotaxis protein